MEPKLKMQEIFQIEYIFQIVQFKYTKKKFKIEINNKMFNLKFVV